MTTHHKRYAAMSRFMSRPGVLRAGFDDPATADSFPPHDVLPDVARRFLADGYPELSRHLSRSLD
jgi:hypothetical protein